LEKIGNHPTTVSYHIQNWRFGFYIGEGQVTLTMPWYISYPCHQTMEAFSICPSSKPKAKGRNFQVEILEDTGTLLIAGHIGQSSYGVHSI
jgi:hypothetical protein